MSATKTEPTEVQLRNRVTLQGHFIALLREATNLNNQAALVGETTASQNRLRLVNRELAEKFGVDAS